MRSSKSRSRSKSNRNRSMGNIVNRVFDSSGPEGKVRGTPQQIIDKYNQLARDAQLGNDRVAFENFQQHAEHYTRMLSEAQREQNERREQQEREQDSRRGQTQDGGGRSQPQFETGGDQQQNHRDQGGERGQRARDEVLDVSDDGDTSTLVETPEDKPQRPRRQRKPKAPKEDGASEDSGQPDTPEAAE